MVPGSGIYVPTLAIRPSEMNGMEFLPSISKDRMCPVFLLAPWGNSKSLDKTIERIERAFPRRQYFLDLDHDYVARDSESSIAQGEWIRLRNLEDRFTSWHDFWRDHDAIMPCLQLSRQNEDDMKQQIESIQYQNREFCLRVELRRIPENLQTTVDLLREIGTADFTVVIEGGWVEQPLTMYAQAHGLVTGVFADLDGRVPIVVSCTSMRKGFTDIMGVKEEEFSNRQLLEQLKRNTNRDILVYGDWGSTRPREDSFGRPPFPRIDYAGNESWYFARNREENWDYQRAARAIVDSGGWDGGLGIWGEEMINDTALTPAFAIDTPQKNIAARVNIHLHRQALHGNDISGMDLDEEWVD